MKKIILEDVGEVIIRKSKRAQRLILKIDSSGKPVVTIPQLYPYHVGQHYAQKHKDWFVKHAHPQTRHIFDGDVIGDTYQVQFAVGDRLRSQVRGTKITINYPPTSAISDEEVQKEALKAIKRAVKKQAEATLPSLLYKTAQQNGYKYKEVRVKDMTTRWGSCSSQKVINLNIWLVLLPSEYQQYVICHELAHLNQPHHQPSFWHELSTMVPNWKQFRQEMKRFRPRQIQP